MSEWCGDHYNSSLFCPLPSASSSTGAYPIDRSIDQSNNQPQVTSLRSQSRVRSSSSHRQPALSKAGTDSEASSKSSSIDRVVLAGAVSTTYPRLPSKPPGTTSGAPPPSPWRFHRTAEDDEEGAPSPESAPPVRLKPLFPSSPNNGRISSGKNENKKRRHTDSSSTENKGGEEKQEKPGEAHVASDAIRFIMAFKPKKSAPLLPLRNKKGQRAPEAPLSVVA